MIKKLLIGILAAIVIGTGAASAYNSTKSTAVQPVDSTLSLSGNAYTGIQGKAFQAGQLNQNGNQVQDQSQGEGQNQAQAQQGETYQTGNAYQLAAAGDLSVEEIEGLLFMREEEKLAHDLYVKLYEMWGIPVISNISQSEASHMESILLLLDRYELEDPASGTLGSFTNADLQALYDQLVAQASQSVIEALKVGALVEETDILDLQTRLEQTDNADIIQVYTNLLNGSGSHLRAFVSTLQREHGETYQSQLLSEDYFSQVLAGSNGNYGSGQGSNGKGGNGIGGRP